MTFSQNLNASFKSIELSKRDLRYFRINYDVEVIELHFQLSCKSFVLKGQNRLKILLLFGQNLRKVFSNLTGGRGSNKTTIKT